MCFHTDLKSSQQKFSPFSLIDTTHLLGPVYLIYRSGISNYMARLPPETLYLEISIA